MSLIIHASKTLMLRDVSVDIPIFIDDKEETIEEAASYLYEYSSIAN